MTTPSPPGSGGPPPRLEGGGPDRPACSMFMLKNLLFLQKCDNTIILLKPKYNIKVQVCMQDIETGKIKFTVSPTVPGSGGSPPLGPKEGGGGPRGAGGSSSLGWVLNIFTH